MGVRSDLEANYDFDIVDEFLDHYSLMIDSMDIMILDLLKPEMCKRSINELFRVFHNIKSASGYLKLISMNRLASFVEDILEILRNRDKRISEETVNWLLTISDMFSRWNNDLKEDNPTFTKIKYSLLKLPDLDK